MFSKNLLINYSELCHKRIMEIFTKMVHTFYRNRVVITITLGYDTFYRNRVVITITLGYTYLLQK